jgi:hypothetical protein
LFLIPAKARAAILASSTATNIRARNWVQMHLEEIESEKETALPLRGRRRVGEERGKVSKKTCIGGETGNEAKNRLEKCVFIGVFEDFGGSFGNNFLGEMSI